MRRPLLLQPSSAAPHGHRGTSWALLVAGCVAAPGAASATDYFVGAETHLTADRWRGSRPDPIERLDVRPRLRLGVFDMENDGTATDRFRFVADLEVATDFGRTSSERTAEDAVLHESRRSAFDLYYGYFEAHFRPLSDLDIDAKLGRHLLTDEVGLDALDGATIRLRIPIFTVEASGGLAVRAGWSHLGPDIYTPDGLELGGKQAYLAGGALETNFADWVALRAAYRRQFRDGANVQREEAGVSTEVTPITGLSLTAGTRYDVIYNRLASVHGGAGYTIIEPLRVEAAWHREHPSFSADSIWNAFSAEPYDDFNGRVRYTPGAWRLTADGGMRQFYSGETDSNSVDAMKRSVDAGVRAERLLGEVQDDTSVGCEGRLGLGYGGERIYGDLFGQMPLGLGAGVEPLRLSGRLGAVHFNDEQQKNLDGVSGWAVVSTSWKAAESVRLELLGEGNSSRFTPFHGRVFAQVSLEDWL